MLLSTTHTIPGKKIVKHLGFVRGNTIRARHVGRDIMACLRNIVGGEISDYTKMMAESREQSIDLMIEEAENKVPTPLYKRGLLHLWSCRVLLSS